MYGEGNSAKLIEDVMKSTSLEGSIGMGLNPMLSSLLGIKAMSTLSDNQTNEGE